MAKSVLTYFEEIPDPRRAQGRRHALSDMLVIAIGAVICGAESWDEVVQFGRCKEKWFRTFLALPHGIPSHDTFSRVFSLLDPEALERCFSTWATALADHGDGRLIAIDGKTLRRSFDAAADRAAIHMISAWATDTNTVLGQMAVKAKSNEITAIPKLLALLNVEHAIVTTDAMGCQKKIAQTIVERGGDYVLQLKGNQGTLHDEVTTLFDDAIADGFPSETAATCCETNGGHGRVEVRRAWATPMGWYADCDQWTGLKSVMCVESRRTQGADTSTERRYYLSSIDAKDVKTIAAAARQHWGVENGLHWALDVSFREDVCRIRQGHAAENLSRLRRIALNLLKKDTTIKLGIKGKRLAAGWDHDYLLSLLQL